VVKRRGEEVGERRRDELMEEGCRVWCATFSPRHNASPTVMNTRHDAPKLLLTTLYHDITLCPLLNWCTRQS
jgi:hypothetical protein